MSVQTLIMNFYSGSTLFFSLSIPMLRVIMVICLLNFVFIILLQDIIDNSDGCGAKFQAVIVSAQFEGKPLLQRHR